jgi:predicted HAD superfamily Cof-like phosphohydrolase
MTNYQTKVLEFMQFFQTEFVAPKPTLISAKRAKLRFDLILEELMEIALAANARHELLLSLCETIQKTITTPYHAVNAEQRIVDVADGTADLIYVVMGLPIEFGIHPITDKVFDEVHRSNMTKACLTKEEALETIGHYLAKDGTHADFQEMVNGQGETRYVVYRTSNNKVLKSINYSEADLYPIVNSFIEESNAAF